MLWLRLQTHSLELIYSSLPPSLKTVPKFLTSASKQTRPEAWVRRRQGAQLPESPHAGPTGDHDDLSVSKPSYGVAGSSRPKTFNLDGG